MIEIGQLPFTQASSNGAPLATTDEQINAIVRQKPQDKGRAQIERQQRRQRTADIILR